eukprot:SAG31_NODE_1818_length_7201_cov_11.041819_6_plen_55_part_00
MVHIVAIAARPERLDVQLSFDIVQSILEVVNLVPQVDLLAILNSTVVYIYTLIT